MDLNILNAGKTLFLNHFFPNLANRQKKLYFCNEKLSNPLSFQSSYALETLKHRRLKTTMARITSLYSKLLRLR